jgi:N-methylhydantoinase B/oxoprolinase/acetone carboxylase alpha subunit
MADQAFAELLDLIRKPQIGGEVLTADIQPVHAALFDAKGDALLVSAAGLLPSTSGALAAVRDFFGERWNTGDVAVTNDMDAGAVNACEIIAVAPVHSSDGLVGWSVVRGRVPDLGGWEPGGYSPQAVDRWAEGARIEPVKLIANGNYRREVTDLLQLNSRTPATTLRNIQRLAKAAVELGRAYSGDHVKLADLISAQRSDEDRRAVAAIASLPQTSSPQRGALTVPWSNERFGDIEVRVAKASGTLRVGLTSPPMAGRPINLGRFAAQDIVTAATAQACGLESLSTDALPARLEVSVQTPSLLAAPLPVTVGLGRQTSGQALFRATAAALGLAGEQIETGWQHYRDTVCGTGFDPRTGKLATVNATSVRERQSEEVVA